MYQIDQKVLQQILKRKFSALVRIYLEQLEKLSAKYNMSDSDCNTEKNLIKTVSYESMREIENQIDSFSKGVSIGVEFIIPAKE